MWQSIAGALASKGAVLLTVGTLTVGAASASVAADHLPTPLGSHTPLSATATTTPTATATTTVTATVTTTATATPEKKSAGDALKGRCNAVTRGSERGREQKAHAPAFADLQCDDASPTATATATATSTATATPIATATPSGS